MAKTSRAIFDIDQKQLDKEWLEQPALYASMAEKLADARLELEERKVEVDIAFAEVDLAIRSNPEKYGLDKITESGIKTIIPSRPKYKKAHRAMLEAKHRVDVLSGHLQALDHRRKALEKLVDLFLANYFSAPRSTKIKTRRDDD